VARLVLAAIIFKAGINKLPVSEVGGLVKQLPEFLRYLVVLFEVVGPVFRSLGIRFIKLQLLGSAMIAIVMLGASGMKYFVSGSALLSSGTMYPLAPSITIAIIAEPNNCNLMNRIPKIRKIGPRTSKSTTRYRRNSGSCFTSPPTSETGLCLKPALNMMAANTKRATKSINIL
jgi:hypothetical protein